MEAVDNNTCPRCGRNQLNVYYSDEADEKLGVWCEYCNLKAYYFEQKLVPISP